MYMIPEYILLYAVNVTPICVFIMKWIIGLYHASLIGPKGKTDRPYADMASTFRLIQIKLLNPDQYTSIALLTRICQSGPKCVSARSEHVNKQTNKQLHEKCSIRKLFLTLIFQFSNYSSLPFWHSSSSSLKKTLKVVYQICSEKKSQWWCTLTKKGIPTPNLFCPGYGALTLEPIRLLKIQKPSEEPIMVLKIGRNQIQWFSRVP